MRGDIRRSLILLLDATSTAEVVDWRQQGSPFGRGIFPFCRHVGVRWSRDDGDDSNEIFEEGEANNGI